MNVQITPEKMRKTTKVADSVIGRVPMHIHHSYVYLRISVDLEIGLFSMERSSLVDVDY